MALVIPPGYAHASLPMRLTGYTRPAFVTWGVEIETGGGDPQAIADAVLADFSAPLARIDNNVQTGPLRLAIGQDGTDPLLAFSAASPQGGRNMNSPSPAISLLVLKRSSLGGRRGRGTMFLPWAISETELTEAGGVGGSEITAWNTALNAWRLAAIGSGLPLQILHSTGISAVPDPSPIVSVGISPVISHQTRRQTR